MRRGLAFVLGVLVFGGSLGRARGADPPAASPDPQVGPLHPVIRDDDPEDEFQAFRFVPPHEKHYLRAGLEVGSIVIVGFVDYLLHTTARGGERRAGDKRWDLRYEWEDLRGKLVGTAYELDANRFGTNYASHPFAGAMYYQAARSNHLSFAESLLFSTTGSAAWEFFGEIRERVSVNDLVVTPVAGAAIGEATMQLAGFFQRGKKQFSNELLAFLFAPVKRINELTEGAQPLRASRTDALGFPTTPWHRFELYAGGGATSQDAVASGPRRTYADLRFGIGFELANLPGYAGAARHARLFDDGNVSSLRFDATLAPDGALVDAGFGTRVVPVGFYLREARASAEEGVDGSGTVLGLRFGFEYGAHDYDRDRARPRDLVSLASPLGVAAEHVFERGPWRVRTALDVYGSFAGVQPYALADFRARQGTLEGQGLPTALVNNGYYHGLGVTAEPCLEVRWRALSWSATSRLDSFRAIEGLSRAPVPLGGRPRVDDQRAAWTTTIAWAPNAAPVRVAAGLARRTRAGELDGVRAQRGETSVMGTIGWVF